MDTDAITNAILMYRYWILIPLTFIEGPMVAFVAGTLASLGYFNIYFLALLFFVRDVGLDGAYYALGYFGGETDLAKRLLKKLGITRGHLDDVGHLWEKHPGKTMFLGKLSYGISSAFIMVAGMVHMSLKKFFSYGVWVTFLQYGGLLFLGYYFGKAFGGTITHLLDNIQYVVTALALAASVYYLLSFYMRARLIESEKEE